eukprot:TRINITY_DN109307_c0_g1_i1.p1 TRINITY_DN109307_c0_g1~~TRINITY_DN109307_c0_g1_i1.p1  ORF type:complete len:462 (-),score=74.76 TRINITY_DN109307_c0_g1_i1:83-1444(-)
MRAYVHSVLKDAGYLSEASTSWNGVRRLWALPVILVFAGLAGPSFMGGDKVWSGKKAAPPPGPLALRHRTRKLRDPVTKLPRAPPAEVDFALDILQRSFPQITTEEHVLIRRWEDLVDVFGSSEIVNQLVEDEPSILRWPRRKARNAFHYLQMYLGPKVARHVVVECPFLLTKEAGQMRESIPALLNVLGSKKRLREVAIKYPALMHVPTGDFYKGMGDMIAVMGSTEAALTVAKPAMERVAKSPYVSLVPQCYPVLVAVFGGLEEAHAAIDREPLLLKWYGESFLGRLGTLRQLLGKAGAQEAVRKAPYLLIGENQRKTKKFKLVFESMQHLFGTQETQKRLIERPELLSLGYQLQGALRFAERKLGSIEEVRDNFDKILRRTGLVDHLEWEMKPRPRRGSWTPKSGFPKGFPLYHGPWSPHSNPLGRSAPARGRWDDDLDESLPIDVEATF